MMLRWHMLRKHNTAFPSGLLAIVPWTPVMTYWLLLLMP